MKQHRPETGPMQFGSDWKGVFIRGDSAFGYAQYLKAILPHVSFTGDFVYKQYLQGLIELLEDCNQFKGSIPQELKPFEECTIDEIKSDATT
jgi:hypothetical protein